MKKVKEGDDVEAIKKASEELSQEAQKIGAAMYEKKDSTNAPPGGATNGTNTDKKGEGPIEGEVVDDKK